DRVGFVLAGPWRHGRADRRQRFVAVGPELEVHRDGDAYGVPGPTAIVSSRPPRRRHIRPKPERKNHTSSTVRCAMALETALGGRVKCAMLPRSTWHRTRTSDPSGA